MTQMRRWVVLAPALALAILLVILFVERGTMGQLEFLRHGVETGVVDQRPFQTAQTLAGLAVSAEEQRFAQEAQRLADHEVDQAFAFALRQASARQQRKLTGAAADQAARVAELKRMVKDDAARVAELEAAAKTSGVAATEGDDLDVAKAQQGLDQDELTDAEGDLAAQTGDERGKIQQELAAREATMKKFDSGQKDTAVTAAKRSTSLLDRGKAWFAQRSRARLLAEAQASSEQDAQRLTAQHREIEKGDGAAADGVSGSVGGAKVKALEALAGRRVMMSILDDRVQAERQLAGVYQRWQAQVWVQHRIVGYLVLESLAWVAFLALAASLLAILARVLVRRGGLGKDPRRARTLETILTLGIEVVGLLLVLLVIFGAPQQTPTILGLATAGLTVVFQDFILAFFGWFVLMGRNGIRVGDWVEIDGVGGEVAEIGLFRTTVLETGNWTSPGHVTGRRVTFINSFAIRGQYFNFSTHGQWMWDEIVVNLPSAMNAGELIRQMRGAIERETAADANQAEQEWRSSMQQVNAVQFSARPTVDLRPAAAGVDVVVRFVTRASERFELRRRVNEALLGCLEQEAKA